MKNGNIGCLESILFLIIILILSPAANYFFGWVAGHLIKWVIGDITVNGINYLFNTTRFSKDMLPTICGTLAVIGSFFKSTSSSSSK